jgi:hypothetical protein
MNKFVFLTLFVQFLSTGAFAQSIKCDGSQKPSASEPINVGNGNGILSAIYDSKEFDLCLNDERAFLFSRNGTRLKVISKTGSIQNWNCKVERHGNSWGKSEMSFDCTNRGTKQYIYIAGHPVGRHIEGELFSGPSEMDVNIELNWHGTKSSRQPNPSVQEFEFKSMRHLGWIM